MRTPVVLAVLVAASIGCGSSTPRPTTTPVAKPAHPPVHVDSFTRDHMKSGFAAPVQLVDEHGTIVASCTVTYDVWRDQYLVRAPDYSFALVTTIPTALGVCLGGSPTVELEARVEPGLAPGSRT